MSSASSLSTTILKAAIDQQASDIHFSPFSTKTDIYFRIHGKRILYRKISLNQYQLLLTYYKFTSGMDIGETRKPQDGSVDHYDKHFLYSLRLSTLPTHQLESLAIRILPQNESHTLQNLLLFPFQYKKIKECITRRSGLILITGPTGSGKTTTLYALLRAMLKENSYQTVSLEDPIEKDIQDILQVQVNEKAGITYQTGLKAALRHDPDIIMIGEIRDKYTAQFAFEAALTGHLVLSTLHASNALGTIHRLQDMGIKQIDLHQSLIAIAAIELLPLQINDEIRRRAAILELLDGKHLETALKGGDINHFNSFQHLRKKAYTYGFITEEVLFNSQFKDKQ